MRSKIIFLSVIASIGVISASICAPAMPLMREYFAVDPSSIQLIISLFLVGNALGQLLSGSLSDYFKQKWIMFAGLVLFVLASSVSAMAESLNLVYAARFFQGMGTAAGPVLARAIAARSFPQTQGAQIFSYGAMGIGLCSILAIVCSGSITQVSWRGCFWITSALGLGLLIWSFIALKEPLKETRCSFKETFRTMGRTFCEPQFLAMAILHSLTYGLMYGYIGRFPFLLNDLLQEKNPQNIALYSALMILIYMLGSFMASRLVLSLTARYMVFMGVILQTLSGLLLVMASTPLAFFLAIGVFNVSIGILLPMTTAVAMASAPSKGVASGALGLSYRLSGSCISYLISLMPLNAGINLGLVIFALSLCSLFVYKISSHKIVERTVANRS